MAPENLRDEEIMDEKEIVQLSNNLWFVFPLNCSLFKIYTLRLISHHLVSLQCLLHCAVLTLQ